LIASFHGTILGYSRQIFALARAGFVPRFLAVLHPRFKTPHRAILAGGVVGIVAIFSDEVIVIGGQPLTANIVTFSVFGALLMYMISMFALFQLRRAGSNANSSFRAPFYPYFPAFALLAAVLCMASMIYNNRLAALVFVALLAAGYVYFRLTAAQRLVPAEEPLFQSSE
jgi:ethanolamine permease